MSVPPTETLAQIALRAAHEAQPQARLVHLTDERSGETCILAIAPGSEWHELLPEWQAVTIRLQHLYPRAPHP